MTGLSQGAHSSRQYPIMVNSYRQLLWLALCPFVAAQETDTLPPTAAPTAVPWGGCEDPINGKRKVTIGEKTTICLTIADGANWSEARTYMRVNFQPIADQYSRFVVPQCKCLSKRKEARNKSWHCVHCTFARCSPCLSITNFQRLKN